MSEERTPYIVSRVSGKAAGRPRRAGRALRLNGAGRLSADAAGFPGCTGVPMDAAELAREDSGRIEYWDADDGVAWMVREATATHERPAHRLPALLDRIAEARGADIVCCGATTFYEHGAEGERVKAMEADQTVYLDAGRGQALRRPRVLGTEPPPASCWRWITPRTCGGASSANTPAGASRRCGWRCHPPGQTAASDAVPG